MQRLRVTCNNTLRRLTDHLPFCGAFILCVAVGVNSFPEVRRAATYSAVRRVGRSTNVMVCTIHSGTRRQWATQLYPHWLVFVVHRTFILLQYYTSLCTLATHNLARMENWPQADLPAPTFRAPPPWEPPAAEFSATQLPASKALCAVEEMRQHAFMAMAQVTEPDSVVYYTDGSADPDSGRTGAAAITRGAEVCERTPDHCSTLQTELVAILLALEHAQHRRERTVVLHTDSRTGLQGSTTAVSQRQRGPRHRHPG
ncbi:hypothetical protein O3P69_015649 [Scylla paramamosain]|uniref:RNase H type-1 domain-containing protein n=1 Tax=Scylla paramamosain TaxID=85552 RepID=A0AAW0SIZ5_SCYPA